MKINIQKIINYLSTKNSLKMVLMIFLLIILMGGSFLYGIGVGLKQSNELDYATEQYNLSKLSQSVPPATTAPQEQIDPLKSGTQPIPNPQDYPSTEILEPALVSTDNWKTIVVPAEIPAGQGDISKIGAIPIHFQFKIPTNWTSETTEAEKDENLPMFRCTIVLLQNPEKTATLTIKTNTCKEKEQYDYFPIIGKVQKVRFENKVGNDGHDSYTVRYYNSIKQSYNYGAIGVQKGENIDIQNDEIYSYLVLHFEPNQYESWLWTENELKLNKKDNADIFPITDTIISTLKLVE